MILGAEVRRSRLAMSWLETHASLCAAGKEGVPRQPHQQQAESIPKLSRNSLDVSLDVDLISSATCASTRWVR